MAGVLQLPVASCWTGGVAVWAPFPQPSQQQQQQMHGLPPLKTSSRGVWLRSDAGGVLAVQWRAGTAPLLTCTLRGSRQLVRAPLVPGGFAFRLLCPQHGALPAAAGPARGSSGPVLFLSLATGGNNCGGGSSSTQPPWFTAAVHFDTAQAGRECGALLQAAQQGSLDMVQPETLPPAAAAAAGGATAASAPSAVRQGLQGPAPGAALAAAEDLFGYNDESSLLAAIQAAQADPDFQALVGRWERAVTLAERLMEAQTGQPKRQPSGGAGQG